MGEVKFDLKPVGEKPSRKYRKGSKYDPVLERFMERAARLVEVSIEGKDANYLRTQLNKRLEARNLKTVKVSVVNNVCYIEKT
jgi:isocitrate dehydrogenase kinase/phosphatase